MAWISVEFVALGEQCEARVNDVGVEELPLGCGDRLQRHLNRTGGLVGTVGGDDFDRVGHGHDAALDQDVVAVESVRVARSVEAFVMLEDNLGDRPSPKPLRNLQSASSSAPGKPTPARGEKLLFAGFQGVPPDLLRRHAVQLGAQVVHDDVGALSGELQGVTSSDAPAGSGHDDDATFTDPTAHLLPPLALR